jgi:regulator of protease activity HflC (stomatin/prohibitin superfamily)
MALDESLTSREVINTKLRTVLDDATDKWGVRIVRVEIQRIEPPPDVTEAMHRQMKAERDKRAVVLESEGHREAAIKVADGQREAAILEATGQAEAIRKVAEANKFKLTTVADGEAEAITKVYDAIHRGRPTRDLIAIKYLEALRGIADGKATKIFLPYEATAALGGVAAISEIWKEGGKGSVPPEEPPDQPEKAA